MLHCFYSFFSFTIIFFLFIVIIIIRFHLESFLNIFPNFPHVIRLHALLHSIVKFSFHSSLSLSVNLHCNDDISSQSTPRNNHRRKLKNLHTKGEWILYHHDLILMVDTAAFSVRLEVFCILHVLYFFFVSFFSRQPSSCP